MSGAAGRRRLEQLSRHGLAFLGCRYAILGGAMTWVSERTLVSALSNAGGFGVLACGAMSPDLLDREIAATQALTERPFGVNLIVMHPDLSALVEVCGRHRVGHVFLAGGVPRRVTVERLRGLAAKVIGFAPSLGIARKLVRDGCEALVIEGTEAGGHIGPVSTSVLAQEILPHLGEVPIFVAGGIARGEAVAMYLGMGASGCQMGTRFVCARESIAHAAFKRALLRAQARDAQASTQLDPLFPVIPVRALANVATADFIEKQREIIAQYRSGALEQKAAQLAIEHFWAGALRRAVIEGDIENGSLMAGQSVGMVGAEQSVAEILEELVVQAAATLERLCAPLG